MILESAYLLAWLQRADGLVLADDANDCLLQLGCGHALQHTGADLTQIEQISKLDCSLLDLELRARRVRCEQRLYPFLLGSRRTWPRRDLRQRCKDELAGKVVGVG